jgi:hypothetical protein
MLRHVVLFRFKPETSPETVREIEDCFRALPAKIPEVAGFEWGKDVSIQGLTHGYTHCFTVSFASERERDTYLPHPEHAAFIALSRPNVAQLLVFDYHAQP